jgi:chaperone LolA
MKTLLVMILLLTNTFLFAQDVEDIIEEVQEKYEDLDDLQATFKQIETFKITGTRSETLGKFYIKDGEKYRFESEDQVVVTDGKTVWTYTSVTNQLIIDKVRENSAALLPKDMLYVYPKEYYSTLLKEEKSGDKTLYVVKLDPKGNTHGVIKSLKLWIEDDEWVIHKIETTDLNDNKAIYEISDVVFDQGLKDSFFTYEAADGVNVVDMR